MMHRPIGSSRSAASALLLACLGVPSVGGFVPSTTTSSSITSGSIIIEPNNADNNHHVPPTRSSSELNAFLGRYLIDIGPSETTDGAEMGVRSTSSSSSSLSRRDALGQAATAAMVTAATVSSAGISPAFAESYTKEPTKIDLEVETDYLIKTLEFFDGDMRKVLSSVIRSPYTTVKINAPTIDKDAARDAILRALYSYEAPGDYAEQASWVNIGESDNSLIGWVTKKRYRIDMPNFSPGEELPLKTTITLSNLEAGAAATLLSFPLSYGYYKYEGYWEEQEAKARKEAAAAKRAAAAKAKKAKPAKEGGTKASAGKPKKAKAPMAKNKGGEVAKPRPAAAAAVVTEGATTAAVAAASVGSTEEKSKGPPPNADAVWQKLQSEMAKDASQTPVTPTAVDSAAIPQPAAAEAASSTPGNVAGGLSAYESYLEQAYSAAPAPALVNPADASAATYAPSEPAVATLVEERAEPVARSAQPLPRSGQSTPFGGGYLDSLSP